MHIDLAKSLVMSVGHHTHQFCLNLAAQTTYSNIPHSKLLPHILPQVLNESQQNKYFWAENLITELHN